MSVQPPIQQAASPAPSVPPPFTGSVSQETVAALHRDVNDRIRAAMTAAGFPISQDEIFSKDPAEAKFKFTVPTQFAERGVVDAFTHYPEGTESPAPVKTGEIEVDVNFFSAGRAAFYLNILETPDELEKFKQTTVDACVKIAAHRAGRASAGYAIIKIEFLPEIHFRHNESHLVAQLVGAEAGIAAVAAPDAATSEAQAAEGECCGGACGCEKPAAEQAQTAN